MIWFKNLFLKRLPVSLLGLSIILNCLVFSPPQAAAADNQTALTVTGDGVDKTVQFTQAELEALPQAAYTFSGYNHWPSLQIFRDMRGPTLRTILQKAGLKDNATLIRVKLNDDVFSEFTKAQLLDEPRYYFPAGEDEDNLGIWPPVRSEKGKISVETMIALNKDHGKLLYGQCAINEPTCCVNQMLSGLCRGGTIEVLTTPLQQWEAPKPDVAPGPVAAGTKVTIQHRDGTPYHALVYYTLDGSEPGYGSSIANISYPNFQPELNKPIPIDKGLTIKTKTIGMGKLDSEVVAYQYSIGTPEPPVSGPTESTRFADMQNHWAKADVEALVAKGIINGVNAAEFRPDANITRAQIAQILTVALKITPDEDKVLAYTDVAAGSWYYSAVKAAAQSGLITGYNDNIFAPDEYVTREQLAAIISRALKTRSEKEMSAGNTEQIMNRFADKEKIAKWAREDVALAVSCGIVNGTKDNMFAPQTYATRAQASVMILRLCRELSL